MKTLALLAALACLWACSKPANPSQGNTDTAETISVSPTSITFEGEGGTLKVAVTTSAEDYTVTGTPEWLTVEKNGKELSLTATANTQNATRDAVLTLTAQTATCQLSVGQKAGSPYTGFTVLASAVMEYGGTILYQFLKPKEENYGGWATLGLTDEDDNAFVFWIYTDLFESAEEVELTTGTYVKGDDDYQGLSLCAKPLTFMPGILVEDEEESNATGSYFSSAAGGVEILIADGTIEVGREAGEYTIKVDVVDESGKEYKYVYVGEVEINSEGAAYPGSSDRIDVANTVFAANCYYNGDKYGNGTSNFLLTLYSGDEENYATTVFEFNTEAREFSEDIDLSGTYTSPNEEEGQSLYDAGTIVPGYLMTVTETMSFPDGTYVMYSFGDYLIGDAYNSLMLTRTGDGIYTIDMAAISSLADEFVMFMGIENLAIELIDATEDAE